MIPFGRVLIVGLGLVGGSWALALRRAGFPGEIVAFDPALSAVDALAGGAVDRLQDRPWQAVDTRPGDLVVLATPVGATVEMLVASAGRLPASVVVTDVGSTKRAVCAAWADQAVPASVHFVGGHPMAGSHETGFGAARADLFDDATYFLVAEHGPARATMTSVVHSLGARAVTIDSHTHDQVVALSSHLPQLLATALGAVVADSELPVVRAAGLAGMTRLAASPWSVWRDTLLTNADELVGPIDNLIAVLGAARRALANGEPEPLQRLFASAGSYASPALDSRHQRG